MVRRRPLPGSRLGTDWERLLRLPSLSELSFEPLGIGLFSSLIFCSQKEKRDENAMLATLLSWAGPGKGLMREGRRGEKMSDRWSDQQTRGCHNGCWSSQLCYMRSQTSGKQDPQCWKEEAVLGSEIPLQQLQTVSVPLLPRSEQSQTPA